MSPSQSRRPARWKIWLFRLLCSWAIIFFGALGIIGVASNELWPTIPNLMIAALAIALLCVRWEVE